MKLEHLPFSVRNSFVITASNPYVPGCMIISEPASHQERLRGHLTLRYAIQRRAPIILTRGIVYPEYMVMTRRIRPALATAGAVLVNTVAVARNQVFMTIAIIHTKSKNVLVHLYQKTSP